MKITKNIIINQSVETVWHLLAHEFDKAHLWMGPLKRSFALCEGEGDQGAPMTGRTCHFSDKENGAQANEVITYFNDAHKRMVFEVHPINVPSILPVKKNVIELSVKYLGANQSQVIWVSRPQLKLLGYPLYFLLKVGFHVGFGGILKNLKEYAETQLIPSSNDKMTAV
jgi:hypothetical protein